MLLSNGFGGIKSFLFGNKSDLTNEANVDLMDAYDKLRATNGKGLTLKDGTIIKTADDLFKVVDAENECTQSALTYIRTLEKTPSVLKANERAMQGYTRYCSSGFEKMGRSVLQFGGTLIKTLGKAALSGLMTWLTSEVISAVINLSKYAYKELSGKGEEERTNNAIESSYNKSTQYSETSKGISDVIQKYEELSEKMASNNTTAEEMVQIRSELRDLQNELVESYSVEAQNVNLVTGAYEEQLDVLNKINAEKAVNYLYNTENGIMNPEQVELPWYEKYFGQYVGIKPDIDAFTKITGKSQTELGRVLEYIKDTQKQVVKLDSNFKELGIDLSILDKYDTLSALSEINPLTGENGSYFAISGTREDINKQLTELFAELNALYPNNKEVQKFISEVNSIEFGFDSERMSQSLTTAYQALDAKLISLTLDTNTDNDYGANLKQRLLDAVEAYNEALATYELSKTDESLNDLEEKKKALFDVRSDVIEFGTTYGELLGDLLPIYSRVFSEIWDNVNQSTSEHLTDYFSKRLKDVDFESIIEGLSDAEQTALNKLISKSEWESVKELSLQEFNELIAAAQEEAAKNPITLTVKSEFPTGMFDNLTAALAEQKEQGYLTAETLDKLTKSYSELGKTINKTYERDIANRLEELGKGGNVNLNLRPAISTDELNDVGWDAGKGMATVFSEAFTNETGDIAVNFTPIMMNPETGEYLGVLDPDSFSEYCEEVIAGVHDDYYNLQIGAEFTGEDALNRAIEAGKEIHKLHEQQLNGETTYTANFSKQAEQLYTFTENGIILNNEAMSKYADQTAKAALVANELKEALAVKEYNKEAKALKTLVKTDKDLAKAYAKGKDELKKYLNTTKNLTKAKKEEILSSLNRLNTLADEINNYDMMEAQIRAATSALHDYIKATETPNLSDNFNTAKSAVESLKTALTNGWTGTDDFRKGMEYIGGYDFDPDIMEYGSGKYQSNWAEVVEGYIERGERYFTEDIEGIYNFLDDAVAKTEGMITKSAEGIYSINIEDIDAFAQKMDLSTSAAMDLLLATSEAWDFDIDFGSITESIVNGLDAIGEESTAARTDMEKFREEIESLEEAGFDVSDLWTAYDEANERIHPSIEFNAELSEKSYGELLDEAEEYAKEVGLAIGETKVSFNVDLQGTNELISKVTEYRDGLAEGNSEYEHAQTVLAALLQQKHELEKPAILNIDSSELEGETAGALNLLQEFYDAYSDYETKLTLGADTTDAEEKLNNVKQKLEGISSETAGQLGLGTIDFTADTSDIVEQLGKIDVDSIVGKNNTLEVKADTSGAKKDINKLVNDIRHTNVKISVNGITKSSGFDSVVQSTLNATTYKIKVSPYATGTVQGLQINTRTGNSKTPAGTPPYIPNGGKASGSSGVPKTGNALVGELGQELVARDGNVFLVGQNGAEIVPLQKGDIVFNAEQTKQLLSSHKINSQGQIVGSFVSGASGSGSGGAAGSSGWKKKKNNSGNSSSSSGGSNSNVTEEAEQTEETFDWIEVKIQRIEEEINRLNERVENTYNIWSNRNKNLISEMESVRKEIKIQQAGYERYIQEANSVGLSDEYAQKVRDGLIDIETIVDDEELVEQINLYQQWYEKAIACSDAVQTLTIRLGELSETNFENLKTEFEETLSYFEAYSDLIDERINRTEEKGYFVSKAYYTDLINYEKQSLDMLQKEYNGLVQRRNEAVSSGLISANSEAWHNMNQEILSVAKSIEEATTQLTKFANEMRQIDWDVFDYVRDRISFVSDEFEFLIDLLDNQKLYDDWGFFNSRGWSDTLLHASKYNILMQESIEYANERAKIEKELANDKANKTLIGRREELIKLQQQSIQNAYAEKEAVKSLVSEGINIHLSKLQDVIDEYKKAINDAKSLYDYQQKISKQTKNIADLEKQLNAYAGDNSEEARATIQKLQKNLQEAQTQLKETEWDKYISETETFLDDLFNDYSEVLNTRLDDIDALMHDMIDESNARSKEIKETIKQVSGEVGYNFTDSVTKLLGVSATTTMVSDFKTNFDTYATTTEKMLNDIKNYVSSISNKTVAEGISNTEKLQNPTRMNGFNTTYKGVDYGSVFDLNYYMKKYPDLVKAFGNDYDKYLEHFVNHGMKEGRQASETFDVKYYRNKYADLNGHWGNDWEQYYKHFLNHGIQEGRQGSAEFDVQKYKASYTDLQKNLGNVLGRYYKHYNQYGISEGRQGNTFIRDGVDYSPVFDPKYYADRWSDLKKWYGYDSTKLFNHFVDHGMKEGRQASANFNPAKYKEYYKDLQNAFGSDWKKYFIHYLNHGIAEGRKGYKVGAHNISTAQMAWTQEAGGELIYRSTDGAILTPLNVGDKVFTAEMSENLWNLAQLKQRPFVPTNTGGKTINNTNAISITLPNVQNYEQFKTAMQNDPKMTQFIQQITLGEATNGVKLNKKKY